MLYYISLILLFLWSRKTHNRKLSCWTLHEFQLSKNSICYHFKILRESKSKQPIYPSIKNVIYWKSNPQLWSKNSLPIWNFHIQQINNERNKLSVKLSLSVYGLIEFLKIVSRNTSLENNNINCSDVTDINHILN